MGHRHVSGTSQMFEGEQDQNWNQVHVEQPYPNPARTAPTFGHPVEVLSANSHFSSRWNPGSSSSCYPFPSHGIGVPHYQPASVGTSHDNFPQSSASGTFCRASENVSHHASSSNYYRQPYHGIDGGFNDHALSYGRGPHKRKNPELPSTSDIGSMSRYYGGASSSGHPPSSELQQEKFFPNPHCIQHSVVTTNYHNNLSRAGEGSSRNVRSRPALDLEFNPPRTQLSINPSHDSYSSSYPLNHSTHVDFSDANETNPFLPRTPLPDANETNFFQPRIPVPEPNGFSRETNHFLIGNGIPDAPMDLRGYYPQNLHGASSHPSSDVHSSYSHRSSQMLRASPSSLPLGHMTPSDDGFQLFDESYSSRQPRPLSAVPHINMDRNRRSRNPYERYRSPPNEATLHDRFISEGFMVVDRSGFYEPRNMFDSHRDMRLDIDSMSYEELLALGERIGSVCMGLSEDLMSKCLEESAYCFSDPMRKEGTCVICLEEYSEQDDIGVLKTCRHDYHARCIRKWLSMKNSCPICKASALVDNDKVK